MLANYSVEGMEAEATEAEATGVEEEEVVVVVDTWDDRAVLEMVEAADGASTVKKTHLKMMDRPSRKYFQVKIQVRLTIRRCYSLRACLCVCLRSV